MSIRSGGIQRSPTKELVQKIDTWANATVALPCLSLRPHFPPGAFGPVRGHVCRCCFYRATFRLTGVK
ncbi:hypothetical protein VFPPC_16407 [Pochonia chlamydosporia 170]|uniref:Uncharacterized protein n=1 Tax=Pochonia chlamydosporia 170 TaxID=1380566 RepID=A0A179FBV8_METCM|nr:hypothetical protein VFPPC_16407 [Pochonia chlamydosporia 170]OAQ62964.1 hypothetical protein VFPPC_16407 [Pochonia chlamydosporia 170]